MSNLHTYGSGEVSFARFAPGTMNPGAFIYLGNTPEFSLTPEVETLDHFDTDHGIRVKDDEIETSFSLGGRVTTDNLSKENWTAFLMGTTSSFTMTSGSAVAETINPVAFGTYQLGVTTPNPSGARLITSVVVTNGGTTYVAGTDYLVDLAAAAITFIPGGTLVAGGSVTVTYSRTASTREQIVSGNIVQSGALHFKSFNPAGPRRDVLMPYVKLRPEGDLALKGEDWLTMSFNIGVLRKGGLASVYVDGVASPT